MLEELNNYTNENKRKFDIVASMGMAELADEELAGNTPKQVQVVTESTQDVGYYKDEEGITRWGVIPKKSQEPIYYIFDQNVDTGYRTSDPRIYQGYF